MEREEGDRSSQQSIATLSSALAYQLYLTKQAASTCYSIMIDPGADLPIKRTLIDDSQALAKELNISWSQLLTLALRDFIRKYRRRGQLVDQINAAYADDLDENEAYLLKTMRSTHRHIVESEW